ncbi:MAG: alpha-amylase family glycosyl hydrolase [Sphingobium sp.]
MSAPALVSDSGVDTGDWWKGAAIYQIYPRSFQDSNGDGIGDLPGITARLDYVASLGVDGIWLSPFFTSPMADFGYDVSDYCDVDPIFGTLHNFDALLARAHGLGLRVLIDQVYAHTSDQHVWFANSRTSRTGPKADWYVWADAKPDGSPPSNWQSVFGGPAWTWDARRGQYYMHNFLKEQPQINGHNPAVQEALLATAKFWLDRGVDGFRVDAINFLMHNRKLTNNPPDRTRHKVKTRPFDFQKRLHNQSQPEVPAFIARIRALTDSYGGRFTLAEVGGDDADAEMRAYTAGDSHFNSAYSFTFLSSETLTPQLVAKALANWTEDGRTGWPSWAFSNHDSARWLSRWAPEGAHDTYTRMVMTLLICLRGNAILWQGEELGLSQVDIPFEKLQDPEAIANWPLIQSRDGARTPFPWNKDAPFYGFSDVPTWLPTGEDHGAKAVDMLERDKGSLLHHTRRVLALRKACPALRIGSLKVVAASGDLLVIERSVAGQKLLCLFNMGGAPLRWQPTDPENWRRIEPADGAGLWQLPPYGALIAENIVAGAQSRMTSREA